MCYINMEQMKTNGPSIGSNKEIIETTYHEKSVEINKGYMTGWICPKCGSVYAPFVHKCTICGKHEELKIAY